MAKPLVVLVALIAAFVVAPGAASAASGGDTSATAGWSTFPKPVTDTSKQLSSGEARTDTVNAVFTCNYYSVSPYYVIDFTCNVTQGAIQLWVNCTDGRHLLSGIMRAVGTYNARSICGPPASLVNFGANQLA
ncbi:hypothetical protein AMES_7701 [Amycolatopsis mediterranei S699]|uniref:Uncharacterized protein n=1 Tax=Amycolatopsis mediterranei (strain U-32) TaxID=749927 RepID=A0A0H3DF23_AMYMU|nr:hypothetical protein AMED_7817 [Amycolatopsis mediterranei U32]AFO81234.1 hypothetical protein AMES_7701 [Amycolatopsis mediterranei S699]AGT88362.1 hypothetical protein B737_7701 [Amycolatopsis mediterranei RB]KDO04922.1 hypothetical protein DV26_41245 [Amycolatopsis mediterranei]KDU89165.1 hypothetical protein DV36_26610 [Amycolatopsis mediterranei]